MDKLDMVLIMSVNPGFGGQSFIPSALDKLREARRRIDASGNDIRLEIDGGVKADNIGEIAAAGSRCRLAAGWCSPPGGRGRLGDIRCAAALAQALTRRR